MSSSFASAPTFPVLYPVISCHAWNGDRTQVAVCPGNSEIHIYETKGEQDIKKWTKIHELTDHDHLVTCIDWAPKTNRILSCSQDRNAYVWDFGENGKWNPSLVLLRINRAAVTCKWSPEENKFAVGSGAKTITVCYFESEQNWWVGKPTKKVRFRSTVLSLAWQPTSNQVLASASSDFKCRLIGAHLKNLEKEKTAPFSKTLQEYSAEGWVHDVAFSPSGKYLGFVSHNSTLTVVNMETKESVAVPYPSLPATRLLFLSDDNVVIGGHSYSPELFSREGENWVYKGRCDHGQYKSGGAGNRSSVRSAFMKFQKIDSVGQQNIGFEIPTRHENSINGLQVYKKDGDNVSVFTSCGIDGRLLFWEAKKCVEEAKL